MMILSHEDYVEFYGEKEADKPRYIKTKCPNCGEENESVLKLLHTSCKHCQSSYDVDGKYLLTLWLYDFAPYSSIDNLEEHHEFIKQVVFSTLKELEKGIDSMFEAYEGCTYTLDINGHRILGVFTKDSLMDDIEENA